MKTLITLFSAVTLLGIFHFQEFVTAAPSGQYSINFHFVPSLLTENCTMGFWEPPNLKCARCFCMTGKLSRCFPRSKCNPTQNDNSTSSTTPRTDGSTTVSTTTLTPMDPAPVPPNGQSSPAPAPVTSTAAPPTTSTTTTTAAPAKA